MGPADLPVGSDHPVFDFEHPLPVDRSLYRLDNALSVVGMFGLPIDALTPVCWCIAGCQGFTASKAAAEHLSRAIGGKA